MVRWSCCIRPLVPVCFWTFSIRTLLCGGGLVLGRLCSLGLLDVEVGHNFEYRLIPRATSELWAMIIKATLKQLGCFCYGGGGATQILITWKHLSLFCFRFLYKSYWIIWHMICFCWGHTCFTSEMTWIQSELSYSTWMVNQSIKSVFGGYMTVTFQKL